MDQLDGCCVTQQETTRCLGILSISNAAYLLLSLEPPNVTQEWLLSPLSLLDEMCRKRESGSKQKLNASE